MPEEDEVGRIVRWLRVRADHHTELAREHAGVGAYRDAADRMLRVTVLLDVANALLSGAPFKEEKTWT